MHVAGLHAHLLSLLLPPRRTYAGAIRQLMKQAPKAVEAGLGTGSDLSRSPPCLSALDWGRMVLEARLDERTRLEINPHFMTQSDACGLHTIGFHMLIPLDDNAYAVPLAVPHLTPSPHAPHERPWPPVS